MVTHQCVPWWYNETTGFDSCPYGERWFGDVTVPNDPSFLEWVAVVYSYIPWLVIAGVIIEFCFTRGTRQFSILLFAGASTFINELIVKRIVLQPRPGAYGPAPGVMNDMRGKLVGTCNITCGMPSSHSTMAIGFLMLVLYDGIIRVVPSETSLSSANIKRKRPSFWKMITVTPLSPKLVMYHIDFLAYFSTWMLLLCPVPLMRVRLFDHSASQVIVGSALGAVYAVLWFVLTQRLVSRHKNRLGETVLGFMVHNYGPIAFQIKARNHASTRDSDWKKLEWDAMIVPKDIEEVRKERSTSSSEGENASDDECE